MYPPETSTVWGDHYPPDEQIAPQTARNREALLYLLDIADCPYRAIGKEKTDCGPFRDDFEINRGWTVNPYGTDTAFRGLGAARDPADRVRHHPAAARRGVLRPARDGDRQPGRRHRQCQRSRRRSTTIRSAPIALPATVGSLTFRYYFAHGPNSSKADSFQVFVEAGGVKTRVFREYGTAFVDGARWVKAGTPLSRWAGADGPARVRGDRRRPDSTVEAGLDDVKIEQP